MNNIVIGRKKLFYLGRKHYYSVLITSISLITAFINYDDCFFVRVSNDVIAALEYD